MSDPLAPPQAPVTMSGGWRGVLVASVLLNCFILGLLVAPMLRQPPVAHGRPPMIDHLIEGLDQSDADILRRIYAAQEPLINEGHDSVHAAIHNLAAVLEQPVVDDAKLQQSLEAVRVAHRKIGDGMDGLIKQAAAGLSPAGRHAFAENGLMPPSLDNRGPHDGPPHDRR